MVKFYRFSKILIIAIFIIQCSNSSEKKEALFVKLPSSQTGVDFENRLTSTEEFNMYIFRNFYNGGGVAAGDISGDGLPDLFFTGNMVSNRLYLNKGNFEFEDITDQTVLRSDGVWTTGVSMVDINGDGLLDIFITKSGPPGSEKRHNELFINNGDLTFTEGAEEYGLAEVGLSTHALFFDYDGDGDLDMYQLNNSFDPVGGYEGITGEAREITDPMGGSKLFRNDDGYFVDVSEEAGIYGSRIGFGLSASVSDVNRDGLPDIYVANDFFERDYLYLNSGDGTFREVLEEQMGSISLSSMGSDIADLTNNGWPDIYVADMLPETERRKKSKMTYETHEEYQNNIKNGFHHQITRNTLQLNNGDGTFSEVGRLAGVEATDWSWAVLMADFDNNGHNDIYVTNGIYKDLLDQDFLEYAENPARIRELIESSSGNAIMSLMEQIPSEPISNFLFSGEGDLAFSERAGLWGLGEPGFSSGAAWADLNGNGQLDLVVSDVNGPARIYRNRAGELYPERGWLWVALEGESPNTQAVGARLDVWAGGRQWSREHMLQRGFQSSVAPGLHVGLGEVTRLDSLRLRWPDGRVTRLWDAQLPARLTLRQAEAGPVEPVRAGGNYLPGEDSLPAPLVEDISDAMGVNWRHREDGYVDFTRERLLVHMRSTESPAMCTGDVTGNGLEDIYLGGGRGQAGVFLLQQAGGEFTRHTPEAFQADTRSEDTSCVLFDANGDGHADLYVANGGNSFSTGSSALMDRLYMGEGNGEFTRSDQILPTTRGYVSSSVVAAGDLTGDGHPDLFVGERLKLFGVGLPGEGYLLVNDGDGNFTEVAAEWAPEFSQLGMITDAIWTDWDGDGRDDLVVVGEWMPPRVFRNMGERLQEMTGELGLAGLSGWWNAVHVADLNGDGRADLVLGNHGLNSQFRASAARPVRMWVGDFEGNGIIDQVLSTPAEGGGDYPVALRHELMEEFTFIGEKYLDYASFGGQRVQDIFTREQLSQAVQLQVRELGSMIVWNEPEGARAERLPLRAQFSPVYGIWSGDLSGDGHPELVLGGNLHQVKPIAGPYDAGYGVVVGFDETGRPVSYPAGQSGLRVKGAVRAINAVAGADGSTRLIIARNNNSPMLFQVKIRDSD